jgi:hypothetical protein
VSPLFGGHKGYGLAFAIQALGLLAGAAIPRVQKDSPFGLRQNGSDRGELIYPPRRTADYPDRERLLSGSSSLRGRGKRRINGWPGERARDFVRPWRDAPAVSSRSRGRQTTRWRRKRDSNRRSLSEGEVSMEPGRLTSTLARD